VKFSSASLRRDSVTGRTDSVGAIGDLSNAVFDFHVTGHGSYSGYYARFSWQDASASGNPAAYEVCNNCHDLDFPRLNASVNLPNPFHSFYPFFHIKKRWNNEMS
jgi:hypothetical protein